MEIDRRSFLAGAGAALAAGLPPRAADALAAAEALVLAPARRADGSFAVMIFAQSGHRIREIALPARGHDLAVHRASGRAVAFARRPGIFAVAFDLHGRTAPQIILAPGDRHFFGHGAYSRDGRLLFATENDFEAGQGVVGIYDAGGSYRRLGEFATRGIGTHEAILMPDGRTLAVANGGIDTHPAFGRGTLNVAAMDPSLVFLDLGSGDVIAQHRLPESLRQLSIRHVTLGADGAVWFGTQWEGDPLSSPSLVGRASPDRDLSLVEMPTPELLAMNRYVGSMAASRDGSVICASAPRGGLLAYWDAATRKPLGTTRIADSSGIAGAAARSFLASNGAGLIIEAEAGGDVRERVRSPQVAFDNHLRVLA